MPKTNEDGNGIAITIKDIYDRQLEHGVILQDISRQANETNGRVTALENLSWEMKVKNHPYRFTLLVVVALSFVVSDLRHPILNFILSTVGLPTAF